MSQEHLIFSLNKFQVYNNILLLTIVHMVNTMLYIRFPRTYLLYYWNLYQVIGSLQGLHLGLRLVGLLPRVPMFVASAEFLLGPGLVPDWEGLHLDHDGAELLHQFWGVQDCYRWCPWVSLAGSLAGSLGQGPLGQARLPWTMVKQHWSWVIHRTASGIAVGFSPITEGMDECDSFQAPW